MSIKQDIKNIRKIMKNLKKELEDSCYDYGHSDDLGGMCAIGSFQLAEILEKTGYDIQYAANSNHVFLMYNNYILDVTSKQFNFRKMIFEYPGDFCHTIEITTKDRSAMLEYLSQWPTNQQP